MRRTILGLATGLALAAGAQAQTVVPPPKMSQAEGVQLFEAGGFKVGDGSAINVCGTASQPKFVFMDLNGDGAPESAVVDKNPAKQGTFLPGSRIPIVSEDVLKAQKPERVVMILYPVML